MLRNANRLWFCDTRPVDVEGQQTWFRGLEQRPDVQFFVVHRQGARIGTASLTQRNGAVEVGNLILAEECRGQGLMRQAVRRLLQPGVRYTARVKPGNEPSRRLFAALGFVEPDASVEQTLLRLVKEPTT